MVGGVGVFLNDDVRGAGDDGTLIAAFAKLFGGGFENGGFIFLFLAI